MKIFHLDYSECHCFRQVTRMAEANVGPPESAPDESGSGEEQKEEKQEEEGEGDRAFEVEISFHATNPYCFCTGNLKSLLFYDDDDLS